MNRNELLRALPKIDQLLKEPALNRPGITPALAAEQARQTVDWLRQEILEEKIRALPAYGQIVENIAQAICRASRPSLCRVINATGVTLHTNLGRACLSEQAAEAAREAGRYYSTLEYDLKTGSRGSRYSHVEQLLCRLTGAEAALVVNNNAAAVLLILSAMAAGGEVIVSRGELVEIGGSFRIPEIMEQCGCRLREVGATNKTHPEDFRRAIGEQTRALLKVHTSNYRIMGFSESVPPAELVALGRQNGLPVIEDLGSGSLIDLRQLGISDEPTVMESVRAGVDVISFSGDKLLGGPQAGIIIGKKKWIDSLKHHPLTRAMRVDKMTLAALEATLNSYRDPKTVLEQIPTLRMLSAKPEELRHRAEQLQQALARLGLEAEVAAEQDQVGGGSVPCQLLDTYAVELRPGNMTVDQLEQALREWEVPIIGRICHDRYLLDLRTIRPDETELIVKALGEILL